MTHLLAFLAGALTATLALLWAFFFLFSPREEVATAYDGFCGIHGGGGQWGGRWVEGCPGCPTERPEMAPRDVYVEGLLPHHWDELPSNAHTDATGLRWK